MSVPVSFSFGSINRRSLLRAAVSVPLAGVLRTPTAWALAPSAQAMLAVPWQSRLNPADYLVSEKLDGVRALWDGNTLRFRSGRPIAAPAWFLAGLPATALDGELWGGRGSFERASGFVRKNSPVDAEWHTLRYMVFDLPRDGQPFAKRASRITDVIAMAGQPWLQAVAQTTVPDAAALQTRLKEVLASGGEGLVLHRMDALWKPGRSDALSKLKPVPDEEGRVLEHIAGAGKYQGQMGALLLQAPDGQRFALGTGFSDADRTSPPAVGSMVTYRYRGRTASGLPRFASFVRVRDPE
jgi:DNA ligase-1